MTPESSSVLRTPQDVDRSCKLPADEASGTPAMMCIGSLDINECERFPSEDVQPKQVNSGDDGRAFLSNVCTGPGVRRQGIAKQLVEVGAPQSPHPVHPLIGHSLPLGHYLCCRSCAWVEDYVVKGRHNESQWDLTASSVCCSKNLCSFICGRRCEAIWVCQLWSDLLAS